MSHSEHHPAGPCPNCGTPLQDSYAYCPTCGQKNEELTLPIGHVLEEVAEGIWHFDSKFWATLKAVVTKPGKITKDFLDGHRVRYVPPIRLYVFVSFVMFLLLNINVHRKELASISPVSVEVNHGPDYVLSPAGEDGKQTPSQADRATFLKQQSRRIQTLGRRGILLSAADAQAFRALPDSLQAKQLLADSIKKRMGYPAALSGKPWPADSLLKNLAPAFNQEGYVLLQRPQANNRLLILRVEDADSIPLDTANIDLLLHGSSEEQDSLFRKYRVSSFANRMLVRTMAFNANTVSASDAMPHEQLSLAAHAFKAASFGMFVLMPLSALLLFGLFYHQRRFYTEHLIHALHLHTVLFLLLIFIKLLPTLAYASPSIKAILDFPFAALVLLYPLLSIRRVYGQGWGKTLLKYSIMVIGYGLLLITFVVTIVGYSLLNL